MGKKTKSIAYSWLYGPGEMVYECRPPFCTPSANLNWQLVTNVAVRARKIHLKPRDVDEQVQVVSRWVEQLIRKELGCSLVRVEKKKKHLSITVSVETAALIDQALKWKARRPCDK